LQGKRVNRVACGSAHTLAWSTGKGLTSTASDSRLPSEVPLEFSLLKDMSPTLLRNRLALLHHFSELFSPVIAMFNLNKKKSSELSSSISVEQVRDLLVSSAKESAFRKVVQATMVRDRTHGPTVELNRMAAAKARRAKKAWKSPQPSSNREASTTGAAAESGQQSAKSDNSLTVFEQMTAKMSALTPECLLLGHRAWKVKFVGESVDDCGGGYSESVAEICEELQSKLDTRRRRNSGHSITSF